MFLHDMTQSERLAFVGLAKQIVAADGRQAPGELRTLRLIEAETGISAAEVSTASPSSELLAVFDSKRSKAAVVLELLGLAYADGEYHPRESEIVRDIAVRFGISETRLVQMENWVLRQMSLAAEAQGFFTEEA